MAVQNWSLNIKSRIHRINLLHSDERQGRGRALNRAIREARGNIVCYYDVDLATDMHHLQELIAAIRQGYDISTGSRLLPDSDIVRTGDGRSPADPITSLCVPYSEAAFSITSADLRHLTANVFSPSFLPYGIITGSGIRRSLSGPRNRATGSGNFLCSGVREKEQRSD